MGLLNQTRKLDERPREQIISDNFFRLLSERKISAKDYAKAVHIDPSTVSKWKSGKVSMTLDQIEIARKFFDVSIESLYETKEEKEADSLKKDPSYDPIMAQKTITLKDLRFISRTSGKMFTAFYLIGLGLAFIGASLAIFWNQYFIIMVFVSFPIADLIQNLIGGRPNTYVVNWMDDVYYQMDNIKNDYFIPMLVANALGVGFNVWAFHQTVQTILPGVSNTATNVSYYLVAFSTLEETIITAFCLFTVKPKYKQKIYPDELTNYNYLKDNIFFSFGSLIVSAVSAISSYINQSSTIAWTIVPMTGTAFICSIAAFWMANAKVKEYKLIYDQFERGPREMPENNN